MSDPPIRVLFFCLGNICRSPLAEAVFLHEVRDRGLAHRFVVESAGTSSYHVGEAPDPGSQAVARRRLNLDISGQRSQQLKAHHLQTFDYLVAMDRANRRNARRLDPSGATDILLLRDFEPSSPLRGQDVPDPWGGGARGFEEVFDIVQRCAAALLDHIVAERHLGR